MIGHAAQIGKILAMKRKPEEKKTLSPIKKQKKDQVNPFCGSGATVLLEDEEEAKVAPSSSSSPLPMPEPLLPKPTVFPPDSTCIGLSGGLFSIKKSVLSTVELTCVKKMLHIDETVKKQFRAPADGDSSYDLYKEDNIWLHVPRFFGLARWGAPH